MNVERRRGVVGGPGRPGGDASSAARSVSTVKVREAGEGSVLPAGSTARTSNVCAPVGERPVVNGEVQDAKAPSSTRHSKPEPGSSAANVEGRAWRRPSGRAGPTVIVVSGAIGVDREGRAWRASGRCCRRGRWRGPRACAGRRRGSRATAGEVQGANAPSSTRHSNVAPASSAVNAKSGVGVVAWCRPARP